MEGEGNRSYNYRNLFFHDHPLVTSLLARIAFLGPEKNFPSIFIMM